LGQLQISVVVVVHDMAREAPRTLYSLSAAYQRHIAADDYEVIVVDNGSNPPLDRKIIENLAGNFRLIRLDPAPPSPAHAINRGLAEARGDVIGVMIDGARIVTPGLLHFARMGAQLYPRAVVASLGWYLGFDLQRCSIEAGYNAAREDALLASIGWPNDGYRLFEISGLDGSSIDGYFRPIAESNASFLRRENWDAIAGADERFDAPGGGFLNLDIFSRAISLPGSELVLLLGEGTFHQIHGGVATNASLKDFTAAFTKWREQYKAIRGHDWARANAYNRTYLGTLPHAALGHFVRSAAVVEMPRSNLAPLGDTLDRTLWSFNSAASPRDPAIAAVVNLAQAEFRAGRFEAAAAVARLARARAPDELAPQRLLAHAGGWLRRDVPAANRRADFHLARAKAFHLLGDTEAAAKEYRLALDGDAELLEAYIGLARLRMPGEGHTRLLRRLHAALSPETYLEIGVARGASIALARPPTRAIGVDPQPAINVPFKTETHIFCETSDVFFQKQRLTSLLEGRPLAMAFIDGLHHFQQALKDFLNVEAFCGPRSVVLFHDTIPFDERTQRPDRELEFYTGDVWKTVLCLRHFRPDLDIFTVAAPWSGLTIVTGFDPAAHPRADFYDEAVKRFADVAYSEIEPTLEKELNVVANDWKIVEARLRAAKILQP
jgi:glycosyltransferase involved in cell wall biosynthesis